MRLLECHLDIFASQETCKAFTDLTEPQQVSWLQGHFLYSLVWSLGGNTDEDGRRKFDAYLRKLIVNDPPQDLLPFLGQTPVKIGVPLPEGRLAFDFLFNKVRAIRPSRRPCAVLAAACALRATPMWFYYHFFSSHM